MRNQDPKTLKNEEPEAESIKQNNYNIQEETTQYYNIQEPTTEEEANPSTPTNQER